LSLKKLNLFLYPNGNTFLNFYIFIKNIRNTQLLFLSITLLAFSTYAITQLTVNSEGYSFLKTVLYNHFTPFYLLAGPCYLFFIKMFLNSDFKLSDKNTLHLIPFAIQLVAIIPYNLMPWEEKYRLVNSIFYNPELQSELNTNAFFSPFFDYFFRLIHLLFYITWAMIILNKKKLTYHLDYIAKKSGFKSRSNFFKIFKKNEKCTPREYLE
jgi:AraC-like DNA-binding protein